MNEVLREILSQTISDDPKIREEATLQLAFILERRSPGRELQSYYESLLTSEILAIKLSEDEEVELVTAIGRMVASDKVTSRMVWVLSKSTSLVALEFLLMFLCDERRISPDNDSIWEALLAIEIFLSPSQDAAVHQEALNLAGRYNLKQAMQRILQDCDDETRSVAERIEARMS